MAFRDSVQTDMNSDGSKKVYVSTLKIHLKPPSQEREQGREPLTRTTVPENGIEDLSVKRDLLPSKPLPPMFREVLWDCTVDEGSDIILLGVITGSQPIRVTWLHNGELVRYGKRTFDGSVAQLEVKECLPEDAGAYTCVAENKAGKTSSSAAVCVRDFEIICGVKSAMLQRPPSPLSTPERLLENGSSKSPPYLRDEVPVFRDPTSPQGPQGRGQWEGVTPKRRTSSDTAPSLRFKNPPDQVEVQVRETARLTCVFQGTPPVVSCWIRNKEQLKDELWLDKGDQSSTLVIPEARVEDAGRYTLLLRDRKNSVQHSLTLSVVDRPQPPASCPIVSHFSAGWPVLSWSGSCYDGGSAVLGYVVEVRREGPTPGDWIELTAQCRSTSYRVRSGLEPQEEYCFRVKAYNAVGVSKPSQKSLPIRMDHKVSQTETQEEELPQTFVDISMDTTHKVTDHYNILEKIGTGKFGQVFKLTHKETGKVYAGKFYKGRRAKEREAARKEIKLMNFLHHPKLVQCLGAYESSHEMVMVLEYIAGGELFERIVDDHFEHTEPTSIRYMQQILEGIQYMHRQSIIHLDLKPENIVCVDHTGTSIKIIDFGLATKLDPSVPLKVMQGTPEFVAPEVINYEPVSLAADMWSVGVICYILLSGESPFQGSSDTETLALVTAAQWEFDEESFEDITDHAKDFISSLLNKDTRRRMSCDESLAHAWIAFVTHDFVTIDSANAKSLSKEKMKKYLARQKWKKAGKALLALNRMALSSKTDGTGSLTNLAEDTSLSPEVEKVLELKLQAEPGFSLSLMDQIVQKGSTAHLTCHITGYPDPEVVWLKGERPVEESSRAQIEYEEEGRCTLVLSQVGPKDADVYTCRASNSQGEAMCSAKLLVKE